MGLSTLGCTPGTGLPGSRAPPPAQKRCVGPGDRHISVTEGQGRGRPPTPRASLVLGFSKTTSWILKHVIVT